jgi:hypothetical protein
LLQRGLAVTCRQDFETLPPQQDFEGAAGRGIVINQKNLALHDSPDGAVKKVELSQHG